ncbi:MAG TPA: helix-turn-helix transcriptional regulator [Spirochaetota bacterium]|nr:helix-turn-helix transcriptional regulator [Spirochaetota bacterium]HSA13354.1 helix-turn-helix transcriptional regulator [Spirochaetota bacterium]
MKHSDYLKKRLKAKQIPENKFWDGYDDFKIGVILKEARLKSGMTQEEVAKKIKTTKSVVSRIENHAENITLSTIQKFAAAVGKNIRVSII